MSLIIKQPAKIFQELIIKRTQNMLYIKEKEI